MKRAPLAIVLYMAVSLLAATAAHATFHIAVVDQVFPGFAEAPDAQYVVVRLEEDAQNAVHGQGFATFDATGQSLTPFATFCPTRSLCDLPRVSPACTGLSCPSLLTNDRQVLIASARARDLFCVTPDLLASGTLPYPDGRVCYADAGEFALSCTAAGPVDCVAYGSFTSDNGIFGSPAAAPPLGEALVGAPARQSQCFPSRLTLAAVCAGGDNANGGCASGADCPNGTCVACPGGSCANLLNDAVGFAIGKPVPKNYHGDTGNAGLPGDSEGSGLIDAGDVAGVVEVMFEFADRRCAPTLDPSRRGADANLDTFITAADIVASIKIVAAAGAGA
jgi:hypothetical protein